MLFIYYLGTYEKTVPLNCQVTIYCSYNGAGIWYIHDWPWNNSRFKYLEPNFFPINNTMSSLTITTKYYCDDVGCVFDIPISCKYFLDYWIIESVTLNLKGNHWF